MAKIKKTTYSNGKKEFTVNKIRGEKVFLFSKSGVPFLRIKTGGFATIGRKILESFLDDEMNDYKEA